MNIADMIVYLRQQFLTLRGENNRQAVAELLATFKMLTRAAYENQDTELIAILVDLTDCTRDLYMGKPVNGRLPTEERIRVAVLKQEPALVSSLGIVEPPLNPDEDTQPLQLGTLLLEQDNHTNGDHAAQPATPQQDTEEDNEVLQRLAQVAKRDWHNHTCIRDGSAQQMRAYSTVYDELAVFARLKDHQPMWAGTFPIDLDLPGSDIDIIFHPPGLRSFLNDVRKLYGDQKEFHIVWTALKETPTVIASFRCQGFRVELFAQPTPVEEQHAYIHMVVEARLLAIGGEQARTIIRDLKAGGLKTEPAFAACFQLKGEDPYQELLELAKLDDKTLMRQANAHKS